MNPLTQYASMIKLIGGLALVLLIWFHGYGKGNDAREVAVAKLQAQHADTLRGIADRARIVADLARDREHTIANEVAKAAADYEDKRNAIAQTTRDAVLADLRAGRLQLRFPTARCAVPAAGSPTAASSFGDGQAAGGGQREGYLADSVAATIANDAAADAQLTACQAVIRAYTAAPGTGTGQP